MSTVQVRTNVSTLVDESVCDRLARRLDELPSTAEIEPPDLLCFSHLRWEFVYQRPQHLLSRCAGKRRVFFVEEPLFGNGSLSLEVNESTRNLYVVVPHLPDGLRSEVATTAVLKEMIH